MIRRDGNIVIVSCDVCDASFRQWGNAFAARAEAIRRSWLERDASREVLDAQMVMTDAAAERLREVYEVSP